MTVKIIMTGLDKIRSKLHELQENTPGMVQVAVERHARELRDKIIKDGNRRIAKIQLNMLRDKLGLPRLE